MPKRLAIGVSACLAMAAAYFITAPRETQLPRGVQADRVVIEKTAHRLTLLAGDLTLKTYAVALGSGGIEPKTREGDRRTPEGTYKIDGRNVSSAFHRSLHISYPGDQDRIAAAEAGDRPGGDIMIHGIRNGFGWVGGLQRLIDWTAGCVAVTDSEIDEIWNAVSDGTPVEIRH